MAAERIFFHRWWGSSTIGYELEAIWEMSVQASVFRHVVCRVDDICLRRTSFLCWVAADQLEEIKGKLAYPPPGSPDVNLVQEKSPEGTERLSAEPVLDDSSEPESEPESNKPKQKP